MKKIKYFCDIISKLCNILTKKQKIQSIKVFAWMIIASVFEMLGVSVIVPFVSVILTPDVLRQNEYVDRVINWIGIESNMGLMIFLGVGIIIIYTLKNIVLVYSKNVQVKYQCQIQQELSMLMLGSYMNRPYSFFVNSNSTEVMRGVIDDIENIFSIMQSLFTLMAECFTVALIVIYMIRMDWIMALGIIIIAGTLLLMLTMCFKNILNREGVRYREANLKKNKDILQISQGIKDIFVMQRKEAFKSKFEQSYNEFKKSRIIYNIVIYFPERIIEATFIGAILLIVCVRLGQGVDGNAFVTQLSAFAVAGYRLLPSMNKFTNGINQIIFSAPALEAAYDNVQVAKKYLQETNDISSEGNKSLNFNSTINVQNLSWRYDNSDRIILDNISVKIHKGESIAFIGESGAGKSTLADIILGLYKPRNGKVLCDGKDIYCNLKEWAKIIAYVPQNVYLLDDTVRANIVFGSDIYDEKKVWDALEQAQLKKFVLDLPNGLDTMVGEAGVRFSGGQRQRIAIARALYNDPEIILLDEATSALDNETEAAVMEAINALKGKKTLIIIAHRLSTIKKCDKVYEVVKSDIRDVTREYLNEI